MKKIITLALLLLLIAAILPAQEALKPSEIFRWVPQVKFKEISFFNKELALKEPGLEKYCSFNKTRPHLIAGILSLPETLEDRWLSCTRLHSIKMKVTRHQGMKNVTWEKGLTSASMAGDTVYKVFSLGCWMYVLRFPIDLDLKKLLGSLENVKSSGDSFYRMPVYHYQTDPKKEYQESYYFFVSPENELVACTDKQYLEKMAKAGKGEHAGIAEDFPFPFFWDRIESLGNYWYMSHRTASVRAVIKAMEKDGVDTTYIDRERKSLENPSVMVNLNIFDDPPVEVFMDMRATAAQAKVQYEHTLSSWHKPDPRIHRGKLGNYLYMNTELNLEDNMVKRTKVLTPEFMEEVTKMRQERLEKAKTRRAEAEKAQK